MKQSQMHRLKRGVGLTISLTMAFSFIGGTLAVHAVDPVSYQELADMMREPLENNRASEVNAVCALDLREAVTETAAATITVNESNVIREVDSAMLGVQCEFSDMNDVYYNGDMLKSDYVEFAQKELLPIPVYRFGGTSSETTNYMRTIGPMNNRQSSKVITHPTRDPEELSTSGAAPLRMGLVEWIKMAQANNPEAQFIPSVSMICTTPEESAQLAQFLTDEKDESEWGAKRAEYGIEEPVKIFAFELGNEIDSYTESGMQWYIDTAGAHIQAIKEVCPETKFIVCGPTAPWGRSDAEWRSWAKTIVQGIGQEIDYMSFHPYYNGYPPEYVINMIKIMKQDIYDTIGENDIKIVNTEHARYSDPGSSMPDSVNWYSALAAAHFLNLSYAEPDIAGANYHNLTGTWALWTFYSYRDNEFLLSPTAKMYDVYLKALGDRVVEVTKESVNTKIKAAAEQDRINGAEAFSVAAMPKGEHELNLIIVNKDPNMDADLTFQFNNNYTLVEETVLSAPNEMTWSYDEESEALCTAVTTQKNETNFSTYHIPNMSVVTLKLETTANLINGDSSTASGEESTGEIEEMEAGFADTANHWAKNEIAKLKEYGFVSGTTPTTFEPDSAISRAEIAAIVSRMFEYDTEYQQMFFCDVNPQDWYSGYANAAYAEGIFRGDENHNMNPNGQITLGQLSSVAARIYKSYDSAPVQVDIDGLLSSFRYQDNMTPEQKQDVAFLVQKGILYRLYEAGTFDAQKPATRAEAASVLYRLYEAVKTYI